MRGASDNTFFGSEPGGREAAPGALALVQAFVNTGAMEGDLRREEFSGPDSLRSWLEGRGLLTGDEQRVEDEDVVRAKEVREALRALLAANNGRGVDSGAVEALNRAADRASLGVRFGPDGRAALEAGAGGIYGAVGRVLAAAHAGMAEGTWARLKACANGGCAWAFYDRSKNRSGRWCSMAVCGNRKKTRDYRRRASGR